MTPPPILSTLRCFEAKGLVRSLSPAPSLRPHLPKPEAHQGFGAAVLLEEGHGPGWGCRQVGGVPRSPGEGGVGSRRAGSKAELTSLPAVSAVREPER